MEWSIDRDANVPIHKQVEKLIRSLIQQEEYQKGKLLPGENEIAERLNISRNTVRMSMKQLVREGLITRKKGIGSKVKRDKVQAQLRSWISFPREMNKKGREMREYKKDVSWTLPPKPVVNEFDLDPHIQIANLTQVHGDETGPLVLCKSYFHPRLNISRNESFDGGLYEEVLEPRYKVKPEVSDEMIEARLPEKNVKNTLNIKRSTPVLYRERVISDPDDQPIEFNESYYRGDRFQFAIRMNRDEAKLDIF